MEENLLIDCDTCEVRATDACDDCVVSFILNTTEQPLTITTSETAALSNLAEVGLVPPLRLVREDRRAG